MEENLLRLLLQTVVLSSTRMAFRRVKVWQQQSYFLCFHHMHVYEICVPWGKLNSISCCVLWNCLVQHIPTKVIELLTCKNGQILFCRFNYCNNNNKKTKEKQIKKCNIISKKKNNSNRLRRDYPLGAHFCVSKTSSKY